MTIVGSFFWCGLGSNIASLTVHMYVCVCVYIYIYIYIYDIYLLELGFHPVAVVGKLVQK